MVVWGGEKVTRGRFSDISDMTFHRLEEALPRRWDFRTGRVLQMQTDVVNLDM